MKKTYKRIFLYAVLIVSVAAIAPVVAVFFFRDRIIQQFIREANKYIGTPVSAKKVDIEVWEQLPYVGIVFKEVYVEDSHPATSPLLTAESISLYADPIAFWNGRYAISSLEIHGAHLQLNIDAKGEHNYAVLKSAEGDSSIRQKIPQQITTERDSAERQKEAIEFELEDVLLVKARFSYNDKKTKQYYAVSSDTLHAAIVADSLYKVLAQGDITTHRLEIGHRAFMRNKRIYTQMEVYYDPKKNTVHVPPSTLTLQGSEFAVRGDYSPHKMDIRCTGKNATVQTLLSLLPEKPAKRLSRYNSKGEVYFNMSLKRDASTQQATSLLVRFGLRNAALFHPEYRSEMSRVNMEGAFSVRSLADLSSASLSLKNVSGQLNKQPFKGDVRIENPEDPYVKFHLQGSFSAPSITDFYPLEQLDSIAGHIHADVSFEGRLKPLQKKANIANVNASGAITLSDLSFLYDRNVRMRNVNGLLRFDRNRLALQNIKGWIDGMDFKVDGVCENPVRFFLFKNQPLGIEANLTSKMIDLDRLMALKNDEQDDSTIAGGALMPGLYLNLNTQIDALSYQRFHPTGLTGNVLIKNGTSVLRNVRFDAWGGQVTLDGIADAEGKNIDLIGALQLKELPLDSVFYAFKNFNQEFIKYTHLKGSLSANVDWEVSLTERRSPILSTLIANIDATLKDGELNGFPPMQKLSEYFSNSDLSRVRFDPLANKIVIKDETVYIPPMKIKSDINTMEISGTHRFDKKIDYRISFPLNARVKVDKDAAFGPLEASGIKKTKLFFKISGATDHYKVSYDKDAVKQKITNDIRTEVDELREAFRNKGKEKKKEVELKSGDYFDWESAEKTP